MSAAGANELLKEDDSLLRNTFFTILKHHHPKLAAKLDVIFALSSAWSLTESDSDFSLLEQRLSDLNPSELILVQPLSPLQYTMHSTARKANLCMQVFSPSGSFK